MPMSNLPGKPKQSTKTRAACTAAPPRLSNLTPPNGHLNGHRTEGEGVIDAFRGITSFHDTSEPPHGRAHELLQWAPLEASWVIRGSRRPHVGHLACHLTRHLGRHYHGQGCRQEAR